MGFGIGESLTPAARRKYGLGPKRTKQPSIPTMRKWMFSGIARATDGCKVEPDGECQHGKRSWLIELGVI